MRKRARNVVIGLALLAVGLVSYLVALEPEAVALQVMAWRARLEGSEVIWPRTSSEGRFQGNIDISAGDIAIREFLQAIADWNDFPVIIGAAERACLDAHITIAADMVGVDSRIVSDILRVNGILLLVEQHGNVWSVSVTQRILRCVDEPVGR